MDELRSLKEELLCQFERFATKGSGKKKEATTQDINHWARDAGVFEGCRTCTSQNVDIAFSKVKTKGHNTITFDEMLRLIRDISPQYAKDHKMNVEQSERRLIELFAFSVKYDHGTTRTSITGNVDKMTDKSLYTGMHKSKFDELDHPRDPREYDSQGYVLNYKGQGTYDQSHEKADPYTGDPIPRRRSSVGADASAAGTSGQGVPKQRRLSGIAGVQRNSIVENRPRKLSVVSEGVKAISRMGGEDYVNLERQFAKFASKGKGTEATTKDMARWFTDAGVFKGSLLCNKDSLDIAFTAVKERGHVTINMTTMPALLGEVAKDYAKDHHLSHGEAEATLIQLLAGGEKRSHGSSMGTTSGAKEVTRRLTDHTGYTGMHKERFDESGQGKGIEGRAYYVDGKGYVGNYKGDTKSARL